MSFHAQCTFIALCDTLYYRTLSQ
uniref:Uncharacterized protein n=1 Tax=Anguilla anguilla TaxID=7936 RepID=A0A0E9QC32_ANGAN